MYVCKNLDNMLYYLNGDPKSEIVTCFLFEVLYFNPQVVDFPQEQPPGDFDCLWNRTLPDFKKQNSLELYRNSMVIFKPISVIKFHCKILFFLNRFMFMNMIITKCK